MAPSRPPALPADLLADLNPEQRLAASTFGAPLAILAGAGTGKTRTLTRRVAYGALTGELDPRRTLVVTFTRDAAAEMRQRLAALGVDGVNASTFHAAALAQIRHFWPLAHGGASAPAVLDHAFGLVARAARPHLAGADRFVPTRDLVAEIEWAASRRIRPDAYEAALAATGRACPVAPAAFVRLYAGYERAKAAAGRLDFADLLARLDDLLADREDLRARVRERYRHFAVDEYQDTSPLADALLGRWLDGRTDLAVVGDPEQTIYTFSGADPSFLTGFRRRFPAARVVELVRNYRSSPQVIEVANRLAGPPGSRGRLVATEPAGPAVALHAADDADAEAHALVARVRAHLADGLAPTGIAVLTRLNAGLVPYEAALARAGIPAQVRGDAFFARPDVRRIHDDLRAEGRRDGAVPARPILLAALRERLGWDPDAPTVGGEGAGRAAVAETLLALVGTASLADLVALLDERAAAEAAGAAVPGVQLLTIHRAKGLEWEAVLLPAWEETTLPVRQALGSPAAIAEERRLAYVAVTRARRHLWLAWAAARPGTNGNPQARRPSRFLDQAGLLATPAPRARGRVRVLPDAGPPAVVDEGDRPLFEALRAWRREAAEEREVPAYVVAPDETLRAIAAARPRTVAALRRVKGMGEQRLATWGEEIVALVARAD